MKKWMYLTLYCFFGYESSAQFDNLKIAKSFEDAATKEDPSVITFSKGKDKKSTWLFDLAAQYKIGTFRHTITTEYHHNTAAAAEINNFQFGYSGQLGLKKWQGTPPSNISELEFYPQLKYRYDKIEGSHGIAGSFLFSFYQQGDGHKIKWSNWKYWGSCQNGGYRIEPTLGGEFQHNFHADSTIYEGFVGRVVAGINFRIGAFLCNKSKPKKPDKKFIFSLSGVLRYDAVGKEYTDSRYHPLIKSAVDWYVTSSPVNVAIGASFTYGDNPKEGFRKFAFKSQNLWEFGLKFQKGD